MKKLFGIALVLLTLSSSQLWADSYVIDTKGSHAFIQFRIKHLGYSWLYGRFNDFSGEFTYDPKKPEDTRFAVEIDMASLDSNHAERDKHLRSDKYLDVKKYPKAKFVTKHYEPTGEKTAKLTGDLTFYGATRPITIDVEHIGGGAAPWDPKEHREGFEGRAVIKPADFGLNLVPQLGPTAAEVELMLSVEGVRK